MLSRVWRHRSRFGHIFFKPFSVVKFSFECEISHIFVFITIKYFSSYEQK